MVNISAGVESIGRYGYAQGGDKLAEVLGVAKEFGGLVTRERLVPVLVNEIRYGGSRSALAALEFLASVGQEAIAALGSGELSKAVLTKENARGGEFGIPEGGFLGKALREQGSR